jgi:predicted CxxxxCH...CXXCH cytochrome family protein
MKSKLLLLASLPWVFLAACSDPQDAPTGMQNTISVHEPGWNDTISANFHGEVLKAKQFDAAECRQCHGGAFDGGLSEVSCKTQACHASFPHPAGWVSGTDSHIQFIKNNGYDLNSCKPCHGQDYGMTKIDNSCLTCHRKQGGPEACNTCHGDVNGDETNLLAAAPPRGLDGETDSTSAAVGAHQAHFAYFQNFSATTICQECHTVPANYSAASHIDADARAEAQLAGALAAMRTEGGNRVPTGAYNSSANTCGNTYCHGNWGLLKSQSSNGFIYAVDKIEGNNASPKWTDPSTAACGSCHGLPPTGHNPFDLDVCTICHGEVVDFNGIIIDKTKHVNGKINLLGMEYPMF